MARRRIGSLVLTAAGAVGVLAVPSTTAPVDASVAAEQVLVDPADAAVLPSAGCGTTAVRAGNSVQTVPSGGVDRQYIRNVPPAHDGTRAVPLVIAIHGFAEGAVIHQVTSEFSPKADAGGFVVVYPQGLDTPPRWDIRFGSRDLVFVEDLLDELERSLCIDTNRIFVSGFSNGAFLSSSIACTLADRVAAIAPVAGLLDPVGCSPSRAVPIISFHGTQDTFVPFGPTPAIAAAWAARNGCLPGPDEYAKPGDDVVTIALVKYSCPPGATVEYYRIDGGGHTWPGSAFTQSIAGVVGYTTFAIEASDLMWEFFQDHPRRRDVVSSTARIDAALAAEVDAAAAAVGTTPEALVQVGADLLRAFADAGLAAPGLPVPATGDRWITVVRPAAEAPAVAAAAAAWGVDGDALHAAGAQLAVDLVAQLLGGR